MPQWSIQKSISPFFLCRMRRAIANEGTPGNVSPLMFTFRWKYSESNLFGIFDYRNEFYDVSRVLNDSLHSFIHFAAEVAAMDKKKILD